MRTITLAVLAATLGQAAELKLQTAAAFEGYVQRAEQKIEARPNFLWADESTERARKAKNGDIVVEPTGPRPDIAVAGGGLVHDWTGTAFLPGASLEKTLTLVQDYNRHKNIYKPEVIDSRLLSRKDNDFRIYLRLLKKKVITVVLNTEHDVHYTRVDDKRWRSVSRSTKISEVQNAGKPQENELRPGEGQGFLWRLDSFWRFEERDGGTWIECQAISLSRDVPTGLGWLIDPIIRNLPKDSLMQTLQSTRTALQ